MNYTREIGKAFDGTAKAIIATLHEPLPERVKEEDIIEHMKTLYDIVNSFHLLPKD